MSPAITQTSPLSPKIKVPEMLPLSNRDQIYCGTCHTPHAGSEAEPFGRQLGVCLAYLRRPWLAWLFGYGIALVTLEHVAESVLDLSDLVEETHRRQPHDVPTIGLVTHLISAGNKQ